jgi:hypothetical protein
LDVWVLKVGDFFGFKVNTPIKTVVKNRHITPLIKTQYTFGAQQGTILLSECQP